MAELQSGSEFSVYCPYPKVRSKAVCPSRSLCPWTTDLGHASYDLPDDVFAPGEAKPTRPKKKVSKKRDVDAMEVRLQLTSLVWTYSRMGGRVPSDLIINRRLLW